MQKINDFLTMLDGYIGGHVWFIVLLLGVGVFFSFYLGFPQVRYFRHAARVLAGKYRNKKDVGDTSHFQALATVLSGTIGTGNIAGVALAIHLGGPAALFWMMVTAAVGMCTKFVEVSISHKYRDILPDGSISGGPMYYMKKKLNIKTKSGKIIKTGVFMGGFFAVATILSTFGTGSLPQINSISNSLFTTFGLNQVITGAVLAVILALVIIGGIKRIAAVTSILVPFMAVTYLIGALLVIFSNLGNFIPSFVSIFSTVFTGSAASGGFLGATVAFAINRGVARGLFSNEAGQGSAPIGFSSAKAKEPVAAGMVAILAPFIDTICICTITGLVIIASDTWNDKVENQFQTTDMQYVVGIYNDQAPADIEALSMHIAKKNGKTLPLFTGTLSIADGVMQNSDVTLINSRSTTEDVVYTVGSEPYSGNLNVTEGKLDRSVAVTVSGKSLIHSAPLTTLAFSRSILGDGGKYIVSIGLLLFAFSTAIAWSYYGDRAITFLVGQKYVIYYRVVYVIAFFFAAFTDTTIIWSLSYITIALMTVPNLIGIFILRKEMKQNIRDYWKSFTSEYPDDRISPKMIKRYNLK
ncbi:MAG: amino acid carrier protein [Bacteroidales bacterium]